MLQAEGVDPQEVGGVDDGEVGERVSAELDGGELDDAAKQGLRERSEAVALQTNLLQLGAVTERVRELSKLVVPVCVCV